MSVIVKKIEKLKERGCIRFLVIGAKDDGDSIFIAFEHDMNPLNENEYLMLVACLEAAKNLALKAAACTVEDLKTIRENAEEVVS